MNFWPCLVSNPHYSFFLNYLNHFRVYSSVQFSSVNYIHSVMQQVSTAFYFFCKTETLYPLNNSSSILLLSVLGSHYSIFSSKSLTALYSYFRYFSCWWNDSTFVFCNWFISLSIMSPRFIHVIAHNRIPFFWGLYNIPLFYIPHFPYSFIHYEWMGI